MKVDSDPKFCVGCGSVKIILDSANNADKLDPDFLILHEISLIRIISLSKKRSPILWNFNFFGSGYYRFILQILAPTLVRVQYFL